MSAYELARGGTITLLHVLAAFTRFFLYTAVPAFSLFGAYSIALINTRQSMDASTIALGSKVALCVLAGIVAYPYILRDRMTGTPNLEVEVSLYTGVASLHLAWYVLYRGWGNLLVPELAVMVGCLFLLALLERNAVTHVLALSLVTGEVLRCAYYALKGRRISPVVIELTAQVPLFYMTINEQPELWMFAYILGIVYLTRTFTPAKEEEGATKISFKRMFVPNQVMLTDAPVEPEAPVPTPVVPRSLDDIFSDISLSKVVFNPPTKGDEHAATKGGPGPASSS